jgi:hypothetical protein
MSQQFYDLKKTAEMLGLAPVDVNQLREQRKLYGYRSGSDWKFKVEEVENLLAERIKAKGAGGDDDVLSDEVTLGESDPNASGTVIGQSVDGGESDIQLADSQVPSAESDSAPVSDASDIQLEDADDDSEFDLDLTIDEDIVMEDSQFSLAGEDSSSDRGSVGGSEVDLASEGEVLDDDDLVLGGATGSGSGSDITIAGDSGISLVDPNDSGISLEQPVNLSGDSVSLELDEDDLLTLPAEGDSGTEELPDEEFLLTPMDEAEDEDDDSGSQVIALDLEDSDQAAAAVGEPSPMVAMLDGEASVVEPLVATGPAMAAGVRTEGVLPEAPYGTLWIVMLLGCVCCLGICGVLSYDIMRNMWSWSAEYSINSTIMDTILSFIQ